MGASIRIKRRATGSVGAPIALSSGELALNELDESLYYGKGDDGSGGATSITVIGGKGKFVDLASAQIIAGVKTFTVSPVVPTPVGSGEAASKSYVDAQVANTVVTFNGRSGPVTLTAADVPSLTAIKISDFDTQVRNSRLDQLAAPTAALSLNSQKLTNVATPTAASDGANKAYVDAAIQGLSPKIAARVASTTNVTIATPGTAIDGVTLTTGDRVLLMAQTTGSQNGLYVFNGSSSAMTRTNDADTAAEVQSAFAFVEEGTSADNGFYMVTNAPITLGTTALTWTQFSGAGEITAGTGLSKSGNTLSINASYTGQSTITTLGTVTTGVWNGTAVALANGGTGATDAAGARTALGLLGMATQAANAVAITGGTIDGVTIDGGTF